MTGFGDIPGISYFCLVNLLRKYISVSFLALFLFPLLEKEVHALEHADIFRCKASDQHFHELHPTCSVCDFIVPAATEPSRQDYDFSLCVSSSLLFCCNESTAGSAVKYFVSLRAPPAAC